jgi:hypothetical protein|tara:strand:- start:1352 stop:1891 length:540 start_codon:yes stop_codon:yes gene_type:complete
MALSMNLTDILNNLADYGVFAYLLPFLLIFAVVFGILEKAGILGKNRGVHATIALAIGLLALQFDYVSTFFASIFPYAGIGIAVVLVALILMGLITSGEKSHWAKYIWFGIGAIAFIAVVWTSLDDLGFLFGRGFGNFADIVPVVLVLAAIGGLIAWIISSGKRGDGNSTTTTQSTPSQ